MCILQNYFGWQDDFKESWQNFQNYYVYIQEMFVHVAMYSTKAEHHNYISTYQHFIDVIVQLTIICPQDNYINTYLKML